MLVVVVRAAGSSRGGASCRAATVSPQEQLAGHTVALLALGVVALLVVATNPFALLFLLPALHAWLWLPQVRTARLAGAAGRLRSRARGRGDRARLARDGASGSGSTRRGTCSTLVSVGYVKATAGR